MNKTGKEQHQAVTGSNGKTSLFSCCCCCSSCCYVSSFPSLMRQTIHGSINLTIFVHSFIRSLFIDLSFNPIIQTTYLVDLIDWPREIWCFSPEGDRLSTQPKTRSCDCNILSYEQHCLAAFDHPLMNQKAGKLGKRCKRPGQELKMSEWSWTLWSLTIVWWWSVIGWSMFSFDQWNSFEWLGSGWIDPKWFDDLGTNTRSRNEIKQRFDRSDASNRHWRLSKQYNASNWSGGTQLWSFDQKRSNAALSLQAPRRNKHCSDQTRHESGVITAKRTQEEIGSCSTKRHQSHIFVARHKEQSKKRRSIRWADRWTSHSFISLGLHLLFWLNCCFIYCLSLVGCQFDIDWLFVWCWLVGFGMTVIVLLLVINLHRQWLKNGLSAMGRRWRTIASMKIQLNCQSNRCLKLEVRWKGTNAHQTRREKMKKNRNEWKGGESTTKDRAREKSSKIRSENLQPPTNPEWISMLPDVVASHLWASVMKVMEMTKSASNESWKWWKW